MMENRSILNGGLQASKDTLLQSCTLEQRYRRIRQASEATDTYLFRSGLL